MVLALASNPGNRVSGGSLGILWILSISGLEIGRERVVVGVTNYPIKKPRTLKNSPQSEKLNNFWYHNIEKDLQKDEWYLEDSLVINSK